MGRRARRACWSWALMAALGLSCAWPWRAHVDRREDTASAWFLVRLAPGQDEGTLDSVLRTQYGDQVGYERLFPGDEVTDAMRRTYLVRRPALSPGQTPWDEAYRLRDAGGFEEVAPDRFDALDAQTRAELENLRCFSDPGIPTPSDPAWSLGAIRAPEAWSLPPKPGGKAQGEGVRVCHPDTGWAAHDDLDGDRLDLEHAFDVMEQDDDAEDPLDYHFPFASRGHGTATGSVIISGAPGGLSGVAPMATLVPIRTVKSVIQAWDSDVARAVHHATRVGCDVISMSLGGPGFFGLRAAIDQAVARGAVVVAAAGNCVRYVVAPASYANTIAVAATNFEATPWHGSCRGSAVDLSAPGEDVFRAVRDLPDDGTTAVGPSDGTSYATAEVAGAAALWLAHHGRVAVEAARRPGETVNDVFRRVAASSADGSAAGWNPAEFGRGILDVRALLEADLGAGAPPEGTAFARAPETELTILARMVDRDPASLRESLAAAMRDGEDPERFAAELIELAYRDPAGLMAILGLGPAEGAQPAASPVAAPAQASDRLRQALRR